jgi:hypothetical protein
LDPVLLPTLFNVLDLLASRSGPITLDDLNVKRRVTKRRFAEIGRVLEGLRVAHRDGFSLVPDADLERFVECWEAADLDCINTVFRRYWPYDKFLRFLEAEECIQVPPRRDTEARHKVGAELKAKAGLTFVAADTFKWWGMAVGYVYMSHIGDKNIYWGGEKPNLDAFEESLLRHYAQIRPLDGFANVGQLADRVCRDLNIAFIRFEALFARLCLQRRGRYITSTSLVRQPTSKSPVQTILPRSQARQIADSLRPGKPVEWTDKRLMENGVFVGRQSVKMVKIQSEVIK